MINVPIHQKHVTTINIHVPNIKAPTYIKQTLTEFKGKRDSSTRRDETPISPFQ